MKANELMVGDWYYDKELNKPRQWHQLQFFESYSNPTYMVLCNPILLTKEILKENGWNIMGEEIKLVRCACRLSDTELVRIYLHYPYMFHYIDDERTNGYEESEWSIGNIRYVHELQHALRLCGLNELADNFEIAQ